MPSQRNLSIDEILKAKRPNRLSVSITLDPTLTPEIERLEHELRSARRRDERENRPPQAPALEKRLEEIKEQINESVIQFTFEDIGRSRFEALVESHPPTDEQKREHENLSWNPDTIAPALISATCVEPEMSLEKAEQLCRDWSTGDVQMLFNAALQVCLETASVPFTSTAIGAMLSSDESSTSVSNGESPIPGS